MREVADVKSYEPIVWIGMRHEADCWIATCAMAAGVPYEETEKAFGSGVDYSATTLSENDETDLLRLARMFLFLQQYAFFTDHGYYPLLMPEVDPILKRGRRYL